MLKDIKINEVDPAVIEKGKQEVQALLLGYESAQRKAAGVGSAAGESRSEQCAVGERSDTTVTASLDDGGEGAEEQSEKANERRRAQKLRKEDEKIKRLELENEDLRQQSKLRYRVGECLIGFLMIQLFASDYLVWYCMLTNVAWTEHVMLAWMSSSVAEVIGIVWVVVRSLFPFNDGQRDKKAEKRKNGRDCR